MVVVPRERDSFQRRCVHEAEVEKWHARSQSGPTNVSLASCTRCMGNPLALTARRHTRDTVTPLTLTGASTKLITVHTRGMCTIATIMRVRRGRD